MENSGSFAEAINFHFSLKGNQKTVTNFEIPQNKVKMRFYGKFSQNHVFSEETFLFRRLILVSEKKMAK